ncbi:MAG: holin [Lachnospiraceae bacterium]|jgi:hypothetical protein|nr:holin [Lachnospiraceae bacterium]
MEFLNTFMLPVILGICLCMGYVVKKWVNDIDNKFIPTIVTGLGVLLSAWIADWDLTPEVLLEGMVSGLASTGLHQVFKQFIEAGAAWRE